jgi:hypothetical protein
MYSYDRTAECRSQFSGTQISGIIAFIDSSAPSLLNLKLRVTTDVLDGYTYVAWCHAIALTPNYGIELW